MFIALLIGLCEEHSGHFNQMIGQEWSAQIIWSKESVMAKPQTVEHTFYEWPCQPHSVETRNRNSKHPVSKDKPQDKKTQENIIRDLQGIFCKGRYRSWVFTQK
jgi:hypothetical protein